MPNMHSWTRPTRPHTYAPSLAPSQRLDPLLNAANAPRRLPASAHFDMSSLVGPSSRPMVPSPLSRNDDWDDADSDVTQTPYTLADIVNPSSSSPPRHFSSSPPALPPSPSGSDNDGILTVSMGNALIDAMNAHTAAAATAADLAALDAFEEQLVNDHNRVGPEHDPTARPFICKFNGCDKSFARKSDLARHFRIHTNERPFACPHPKCGKSFIQRSALTVHFRTHTGEKPHHCETCNKAFADSSSLARHRRIHTGKRPYICKLEDCNRAFARRNTFLKHHKRQHPQIPAPSTAAHKNTVHLPVIPPLTTSSSLLTGSSISDAPTSFWIRTPSTGSTPHGLAASHPPGSAASLGGGVGPIQSGSTGYQRFLSGGHGHGYGGGVGPGAGIKPVFIPNPADFAKGKSSSASDISVTTPLTTYDELEAEGEDAHSPITPLTALTTTSATSSAASDQHHQHQLQSDGASHSLRISPGLPSAGASSSGSYPTHPGTGTAQEHAFPRASSTGGMMYYRQDSAGGRAVSDPLTVRGEPYASGSWVGGGFSMGQLTIPPQHQAQLTPGYTYPLAPTPTPMDSSHVSAVNSPVHSLSRRVSPERENADGPAVPHFSFQAPSGQPMSVPLSAVEAPTFAALNPTGPPYSPYAPLPVQSAPPTMQRFHSSPAVPFATSTAILSYPSYADTGSTQLQSYPMLGSRSIGGSGSSWTTINPNDTSVSNGIGASSQEYRPAPLPTPYIGSHPITPQAGTYWGHPIAYPQPSMSQRQVSVSPSTVMPTTGTPATLVGSISHSTAMYGQYGPFTTAPLTFPPSVQQGGRAQQQPPYYTPVTPQYWNTTSHPQSALTSPTDPVKPTYSQYRPHYEPSHADVTNITLSTPTAQFRPKAERTVSSVGLGLANVSLGSDEQMRMASMGRLAPEVEVARYEEGEEEMDDEDVDGDIEEADDSDDDFVLGRNKKKAGAKKGKKGHARRASGRRKMTA